MTIDGMSIKDLVAPRQQGGGERIKGFVGDRKAAADNYDREDGDALIPDPRVADRYHVSTRTIWRWDHTPHLNFPEAVRINNRNYRRLGDLRAWERARAAGKPVQVATAPDAEAAPVA
jgi:hypothetical protein